MTIFTDRIVVDIINPCETSILEPTLTVQSLYAIIGLENNEFKYDNYPDKISKTQESTGLIFCGNRVHELYTTSKTPTTVNEDYIELKEVSKN